MTGAPSTSEAVAIAAAIQRFLAETASGVGATPEETPPWQRAALLEGVQAKAIVQQHREGGVKWLS